MFETERKPTTPQPRPTETTRTGRATRALLGVLEAQDALYRALDDRRSRSEVMKRENDLRAAWSRLYDEVHDHAHRLAQPGARAPETSHTAKAE